MRKYLILDKKSELQKEIIDKFIQLKPSRSTIILPTGVGKTRVSLQIAQKLFEENLIFSCLIVTPTTVLKDDSWPKEIELLGLSKLNIQIECKQTAYKFTNKYDLIIVDEVHMALSDIHGKVLNIPCDYMLGLTATLPDHNAEYTTKILTILPVFYSISLGECVVRGIVPSFNVLNLKVKLNRSERGKYSVYNVGFEKARIELAKFLKANPQIQDMDIFDLAKEASSNKLHPLHKIGRSYWSFMSLRKWVCYRAESKLKMCVDIIKKFPNKKWIVFSKEIKFVELLAKTLNDEGILALAYHSNMKPAERDKVLLDIINPMYQVLVSAEALNVGYNLPDLDAAINASGVSTELSGIQTIGRINRYKEGKVPVMINLACENTQEMVWVENRTKNISARWIHSIKEINIDYGNGG